HRLAQDAQPRGRPEGDHRQLRRAGPDRDGAARRALPGRPDRRAAGGDRAAPLGNAARGRRRRLLPRLRPRALRHWAGGRRRRRTEAVPVLKRHLSPWRVLGGVVVLAVLVLVIVYVLPSGDLPGQAQKYILLPDVAHPVSPLVRVQGARPAKP